MLALGFSVGAEPALAQIQDSFPPLQVQEASAESDPLQTVENMYSDLEPEELVLAVNVDSTLVSKGVAAYSDNNEYYFSIPELAQLFKIYIDPASNAERLSGYVLNETKRYEIDFASGTIAKNGVERPVTYPLHVTVGDQTLVNLKALEEVWDFKGEVETSGLSLRIKTVNQLPFQVIEAQRRLRKKMMGRNGGYDDTKVLPFIATPYKAFSLPTIDISTRAGYDAVDNTLEGSLAVSGVQDLLWASADYSATLRHEDGQFDAPDNLRFRLTRENIHKGALPFDLERVELGDVSQRNRELIGRTLTGKGFTFTNNKKFQVLSVAPISIEEPGIPGYEVELYRNQELIDTGVVGADGLYRYEGLDLFYGENDIELIFYGPQGETKEVDKSFLINRSIVQEGKTLYNFSALRSESELFEIDEENEPQPKGLTMNGEIAHGITQNLSAFGAVSVVPTRIGGEDVSNKYVSAGVDVSALNALTRLEGYKQLNGGSAAYLKTLTSLMNFKLNFQLSMFKDFESTEAGIVNQKDREAELQVRRNFTSDFGTLGLNLRTKYTEFEGNTDRWLTNFRQSITRESNRLTNNITITKSTDADTFVTGQISNLTRFTPYLRMRNGFNYDIRPETEFKTAFSELRHKKNDLLSVLRADYDFEDQEKRLGVTISKDLDTSIVGVDTQWSSEHGFSAFLRLSTSFGPYGKNDEYIFNSKPLLQAGSVAANVYHDKNYNGIYDEDDEPIENAAMSIGPSRIRDLSDSDGDILSIQPTRGVVPTELLAGSLEDPYQRPAVEGYEVRPRPGVPQRISFPVVDTGAVEGTIVNPFTQQSIADLEISAIDLSTGKVVKKTTSGYDGYFSLEFLMPGQYKLQTRPVEGLGYFEKTVAITPNNLDLVGISFTESDLQRDDLFTLLKQTEESLIRVLPSIY
ncbi:MAG: hypothetical protein GC136_10680 [Alphaproteobacteria bacterium]|nr:hypothetical protein [Alphaproteobacteria bacterium]